MIKNNTLRFRFVNNTNLIAWGNSAADNYRQLTVAHNRCIVWAKRHSTKFLSNKYALMHFTRRKRDSGKNLLFTVNIRGLRVEVKKVKLRILEV